MRDLNRLSREEPALHEQNFSGEGFQWVDYHKWEESVLSFLRRSRDGGAVLVVVNLTPIPRENYRLWVDRGGFWAERLNSDAAEYGGSGWGNHGGVEAIHARPGDVRQRLRGLACPRGTRPPGSGQEHETTGPGRGASLEAAKVEAGG